MSFFTKSLSFLSFFSIFFPLFLSSLFFFSPPPVFTKPKHVDSRGLVAFEGKYVHQGDACPRCLGGRAIACPECGGLVGRRSLFSHSRLPRASAGVLSSVDPGAGLGTERRRRGRGSTTRRKRVGELLAAVVGRKSAAAASAGDDQGGYDDEADEEDDDNRRWLGFGAQQTLAD